jgi:hypothetical protein
MDLIMISSQSSRPLAAEAKLASGLAAHMSTSAAPAGSRSTQLARAAQKSR